MPRSNQQARVGQPGAGSTARPRLQHYWPLAAALLLCGLSLGVRFAARNVVTSDLDFYVLRWISKFQQLGVGVGLGKDFYNYSPPYMYLLALLSMVSGVLPVVAGVKLVSTAFDLLAAFAAFKIVKLESRGRYLPHLAAALVFAAPTVVTNSAIWGQADSSYTAFLLLSIYFLLIDQPLPGLVLFSVAFSFKPQAIFLAPFLLVLVLWKRLPWHQ